MQTRRLQKSLATRVPGPLMMMVVSIQRESTSLTVLNGVWLKSSFTLRHGVTFQLMCGRGTYAQRLDSMPADTLKECADKCALHNECQTADWNGGMCHRKREYIPTVAGVYDTWFPIEQRPGRACPPDRLTKLRPDAVVTGWPHCPDGNYYLDPTLIPR